MPGVCSKLQAGRVAFSTPRYQASGWGRSPQDATELVSRLTSYHYTAQTRPEKKHFCRQGLDLLEGTVRDNVDAGVLEPVLSKVKIVQARPPGRTAPMHGASTCALRGPLLVHACAIGD